MAEAKKRQVKNPESFRERAEKATKDISDKKASKSVFSSITSPIKKVIVSFFNIPLVKTIFKPFKVAAKFVIPKYFRTSFQELKLVTWPTLKQSRQLTVAVLIFAVIFGATIAVLDLGLDKLFKNLLLK